MKFYSEVILPWAMDRAMSKKEFREKRKELLKSAKGKILEIGLGTGLNLLAYPKYVKEIFAVDINPGMNKYAEKRSKSSGIKINSYLVTAQKLPFSDNYFDTVVSTWTLCSIDKPEFALKEIYRVLKKGGHFIFVEHGLSDQENVRRWQKNLSPLWAKLAGGCRLEKSIKQIILTQSFKMVEYNEFKMENMSSISNHMYEGIGMK